MKSKSAQPEWRNAAIGKIHIAKKRFGLSDEVYRAIMARACNGKTSAADLTADELGALIDYFKEHYGFAEGNTFTRRLSDFDDSEPQARLIRALWSDCVSLGVVKDGSERALQRFVRRVAKTDHLNWLTPQAANAVIEGLKTMKARSRAKRSA